MDRMTGIKYTWNSKKTHRIHLIGFSGQTLCGNAGGCDVISDDRPRHKKVCGVCRLEVGMSKQEAKANPAAAKADQAMMKSINRVVSKEFYWSYEWRALRYRALVLNDGRCECCGNGKQNGVRLNVDHIKPRSKYPELALKLSNLQVLCEDCNHGKSNTDETDWREPSLQVLMSEEI